MRPSSSSCIPSCQSSRARSSSRNVRLVVMVLLYLVATSLLLSEDWRSLRDCSTILSRVGPGVVHTVSITQHSLTATHCARVRRSFLHFVSKARKHLANRCGDAALE